MNEIKQLIEELERIVENANDFTENPNKTKSKNLRLQLGEIKKGITDYRRILMELDKEGY